MDRGLLKQVAFRAHRFKMRNVRDTVLAVAGPEDFNEAVTFVEAEIKRLRLEAEGRPMVFAKTKAHYPVDYMIYGMPDDGE